ncbi:hypothetical protein HPO96_01340 [Kribbella sandramycini]|uniref:DUF998 domain-containing protein n=1 Tax=Kribbella sandramycini TaxID=60450 RepID=A0A7Y4KUE8_9ACTN|nr:hypothetical protein [Kribbella sandramycini]MBB6568533.1 hypothetical protein [Kribbella sandramycini]NOL38879.1 hypothetical protein [Kribbella sandramycini]
MAVRRVGKSNRDDVIVTTISTRTLLSAGIIAGPLYAVVALDPAVGFPEGVVSRHGIAHFAAGGIGFLALIAFYLAVAQAWAWISATLWQRSKVVHV